jgi:hypothetical protein
MKWLEIINFQYVGGQRTKFKLNQLMPLIKQAQTESHATLQLFSNAIVEDDLSIQIIHETNPHLAAESPLSMTIRSALNEFGLSSYSRWIKEIED